MERAFLKLVDVTKRYGERLVVDRLSIEVAEGEVLALLGPSGCGKTTTLRIVAGLETPDSGEVWLGGYCVGANGRNLIAPHKRGIGFVFQDLALWPHLTVTGNLEFVLASNGVPKRERGERIAETLRMMRMERHGHTYPSQLSGGEQQRVALARAIIGRPGLLLLDEPMSSIDADLKYGLLREISDLHELLAVTTIYITHDQAEANTVAQRIALMREGRIEGIIAPGYVDPDPTLPPRPR